MKKVIKLLVAAAVLLTAGISALSAQESKDSGINNRNAIGVYVLGASNSVGGIQYERRFTDVISAKFDTYIYYSNDAYYEPFDYNVNAEIDFTLYESEWNNYSGSRLFVYGLVGNRGYITGTSDYNYEADVSTYTKSSIKENVILSAGFGFDLVFFKHISIPFQFGFMGNLPNDISAGFCGGAGLRYSW